MAFHEVVFPIAISYGSSGGPGHRTSVLENPSGQESRNSRTQDARRKYDVASGPKSPATMALILDFIIARNGAEHGFLWKDWTDYSSASDHVSSAANTDETIGTGDGVSTQFQLRKSYTDGAYTKYRTIEKPVSGTVTLAVAGVAKTEGVDYTVNYTTGVVTMNSAVADGSLVTAGFEFYVPVRFGEEADALLDIAIEDFDNREIKALPVIEIKPTRWIDSHRWYGGSALRNETANFTLSEGEARVQLVTTSSGVTCKLPDPTSLPAGGEYFYIYNIGSNSMNLLDFGGSTLIAIGPGQGVTVVLGLDASSNPLWIAF